MTTEINLIDGNSICYASHNTRKLSVGDFETQAIYGTIRAVRNVIDLNPESKILVLWDGRSQWRRDIYPDYKANRKPKDAKQIASKDSYKKQSPYVKKGLSLLGIRQMMAYTHEADDLGGMFVKRFSAKGVRVKVTTADQDWLQLVDENSEWIDPINDRSVNLATFTSFTGYLNTKAFLQAKALIGDVSDNITGIERLGPVAAQKILIEHGSVEDFYAACDAGRVNLKTKVMQRAASAEGREIFARNMKLMDLRNVPVPEESSIVITQPTYNEDLYRRFCDGLSFTSITRNFDTFMIPFRHAYKLS